MTRFINNIISTIIGAIEILLLVRMIMRLLGANPASGFTEMVYGASAFFLAPFQGIFPTPVIEGATFELSTLFAIIAYALIGWLITAIIASVANIGHREDVVIERRHHIE